MRTQLSKLVLAAALGLAMAFTLSCSDDKDEVGPSTAACKYTDHSIEICDEFYGEEAAYNKVFLKQECEEDGGTYYDSCPGGYTLKCYDDGMSVYIYSNLFSDCDAYFH